MNLKTIKRTKTTSIVLAEEEFWGILPNKILHFYSHGQPERTDFNTEEAEKLLEEIKRLSWNKLIDYLAYRERSFGECKTYLSQKLFLKKELQSELLDKAVSNNFINDERFAEMLTEELIRNSKSKVEIMNKLYGKKIDEKIITQIIQEKFNSETAEEILNINISKAQRKFSNLAEDKRKEKILNYLTRKGFTYWEVKEKLRG